MRQKPTLLGHKVIAPNICTSTAKLIRDKRHGAACNTQGTHEKCTQNFD